MGKNYIVLLLLFIFHLEGSCQVEFGIKGGYTNSWPGYGEIELPEGAETDVDGFNLSIFISGSLIKDFGLSFNPGYVKRGAACFPGWQPNFASDSKVFLNYFEFPLMIYKKFKFNAIDMYIVPSIGYGISYLNSAFLHEEWDVVNAVNVVVSEITVGSNLPSSFGRIDRGFYFNFRIDKPILLNHFIFLESSYFHGMKDYDQVNTSKNRNLNFSFGFGYSI